MAEYEITPEDRALVDKGIELERQCAFLSDQLNTALLMSKQVKECLETVRAMHVLVKDQIKDRSLNSHYRSALYGNCLMKGL